MPYLSRVLSQRALVLFVLAMGIHGCSPADNAPESPAASTGARPDTIDVTDDMRRTVAAPRGAHRIAVLVPFAADMLLEMGTAPVLVPAIRGGGPESWRGIPTVAVDHSAGPNIEQVVASRPDLIIATAVHAQFLAQIEVSVGAPVLVLDVSSLGDVARHLRTLGMITGRESAAEELASKVERAGGEFDPAEQGSGPTRVLAIFGTPHAFYGFLPESYVGDLVKRCGGRLVTEGLVSHKVFRGLSPLSMEAIVAENPGVILVVFHGPSEAATAMLAQDPAWNRLDAVVNGRVRVLSDELFVVHPGSRPTDAIAEIAAALEARSP